MNAQKFTQKSLEAMEHAQQLTIARQNQQMEQIHLLLALLTQEQGLIPQLLRKMGVDDDALRAKAEQAADRLPGVSGPGRENDKFYISREVDEVLAAAEKAADGMRDEYVSVEHLFLALLEHADNTLKDLFRDAGIRKNDFLKTLATVRGGARVQTDNPESTYDALN